MPAISTVHTSAIRKERQVDTILLLAAIAPYVATFASSGVSERQYVPVVTDASGPYFCNLARVRDLRSGRRLAVRTGPAQRYDAVTAFHNGQAVYICNDAGEWLGVAFGQPGRPCGDGVARPLPYQVAASCRTGWVHRRWIEILTG